MAAQSYRTRIENLITASDEVQNSEYTQFLNDTYREIVQSISPAYTHIFSVKVGPMNVTPYDSAYYGGADPGLTEGFGYNSGIIKGNDSFINLDGDRITNMVAWNADSGASTNGSTTNDFNQSSSTFQQTPPALVRKVPYQVGTTMHSKPFSPLGPSASDMVWYEHSKGIMLAPYNWRNKTYVSFDYMILPDLDNSMIAYDDTDLSGLTTNLISGGNFGSKLKNYPWVEMALVYGTGIKALTAAISHVNKPGDLTGVDDNTVNQMLEEARSRVKDASDEARLDLKQSGLQASYQIHF